MMTRIEELEKQIQELQKELEFEKNKFVIEYPFEKGEAYWLLYNDGCISQDCWDDDIYEQECYEMNNVFKTKEEARKEYAKRILLKRFRQYRDKCNGDWKPALKIVGLPKYCIAINNKTDVMFAMDVTFYNEFNPFGYFKKKEDCNRAIQLFGDEIKRLFVEEEK